MSTSVYIISQEQIISIWDISTNLEKLQNIIELAVYISYQRDRAAQILYVVFGCKDLFYFGAN